MSLYKYWAYGLCIHSELACPELPLHPQPTAGPDVSICLSPPVRSTLDPMEHCYFEVRPGLFRLAIEGVAQYTVQDGSSIVIEPVIDASPEKVRLFLLGSTMGALLYQRGLFPLHGSAVETPWGAMIFVGAQGAGKSTLAAQFHHSGYRLLSDDVCAVTATADGLRILPALAHVRLCADAYERLGTPAGARFDIDKYVVPMGEGYCPDPVPLRAIHVLSDQDGDVPQVVELRGFDRVQRLLENLYRPHFLEGQQTQADLMRLAGRIARETPLLSVTRRRDVARIAGLVSFLEKDWAQRFAAGPAEEGK